MTTRSRFSIAKATSFIAYSRTASTLHQVAVVCLFPVPGLLVTLPLSLVPLQHPTLGALRNWGFFVQVYVLNWLWMASAMAQARTVSAIPLAAYPTRAIAVIATLAAAPSAAIYLLVGCAWRFPVPFFPAATPVPFMMLLVAAPALVFRGGRLPHAVRAQLLRFLPSLAIQVSQLAIYPIYSTFFAAANDWQQLLLVLLFPCLKFVLRRAIFAVSRHAHDFAKEGVVSGVEISASIYQAMIMQTTPAAWVTGAIIALDVLVGVVAIRRYLDRNSVVPTAEILSRAVDLLENSALVIRDDELKA